MPDSSDVFEKDGADARQSELDESIRRGHEMHDVSVRSIAVFGAILAALLGIAFLVAIGTESAFKAREARDSPPANPLAAKYGPKEPPKPRLQVNPTSDLAKLRASEDAILTSYGWVDRSTGTVRIPIARALELTAERGLAARDEAPQDRNGIRRSSR